MRKTRRSFLRHSSQTALAASSLGVLGNLPRVSAQEAQVDSKRVQFASDIEPLVQLVENSSRDQVLKKIAAEIRGGTSYQEVLTALFLAAIRNVQPYPAVGFKFHCVLVVNSCHLASIAGPDDERWLPLFWAIDYFKSSQADEERRSGWQMPPLKDASQVPMGETAAKQFDLAMQRWDAEQADSATAGLVRSFGANEVFEHFARYAARDYRSIGHKAIYLANGWRTLQVIGWQHAEPVLRSLTSALLNHNGEPNPAQSDLSADRSWRENESLASEIPDSWISGKLDDGVPPQLFECFRSESPLAAAQLATQAMQNGVAAQSIWDGVFVGAGELLMRQPGIIGLHGLTTANAMHYIWQTAQDESVRKQILLQACSFNPQFRESAIGRGKLSDHDVSILNSEASDSNASELSSILDHVSNRKMQAAQELLGYLEMGGNPFDFIDETRRLLFFKGRDAHDYKFSSAVLEDFVHVSPNWRNRFLATSVFNLKGSQSADSNLVQQTHEALEG